MKKIISIALLVCVVFALCVPAFAANEGEERAVIGADLSDSQILTVYGTFGLIRGSVRELKVTNAEERAYLEGLVSDSIIGTRSISCVYIRILPENSGLTVTASNITWCTENMYRSALMTAGIYDAEVKVTAPYPVSGTAALTGIYKAYEDITGRQLEEEAKTAAADELVLTAELADTLTDAIKREEVSKAIVDAVNAEAESNDELTEEDVANAVAEADAVAIVNELKLILDETQNMSDDELRGQIETIAAEYGYEIDADLINRLIELVRSMEGLSISDLTEKVEEFKDGVAKVRDGVERVRQAVDTIGDYAEQAVTLGQRIVNFLQSIVDFFRNLFGGGGD